MQTTITKTPTNTELFYQVPAMLIEQLSNCRLNVSTGTTTFTRSIGIGITTHNRRDVFNTTLAKMLEYLPAGAVISVVDDASTDPVVIEEAVEPIRLFRFNENVGIAGAKNKCLEMLQHCEHIFLFDDDTYPLKPGWEKPYIQSGMNHLMYIFESFSDGQQCGDMRRVYQGSGVIAYNHVRGCMLYYRKICLEKAGGMDTFFGKWGHEHGDLSNRIFNFGLTPFRYMDVENSKGLFFAGDEHRKVTSTFPGNQRNVVLLETEAHYNAQYSKAVYHEYRQQRNKSPLILTSYFTETVDPQRNAKWEYKDEHVKGLVDSAKKLQVPITMLTDFDYNHITPDSPHSSPFHGDINPYFKRWLGYYDYIVKHADELSWLFCVDATDVELLNLPIPERGKIYVGDEENVVNNEWMVNHHKANNSYYRKLYDNFGSRQLCNAGIMGGYVEDVMRFLRALIDRYTAMITTRQDIGLTDMALFNSICYDSDVSKDIVTGRMVNTEFKADKRNQYSWFKHK